MASVREAMRMAGAVAAFAMTMSLLVFLGLAVRPLTTRVPMHYKNGRPAQNGDRVVVVAGSNAGAGGILHGAVPGNNTCNGNLAPLPATYCNLSECLHADDVVAAAKLVGPHQVPEAAPLPPGRATDPPAAG